MKDSNFAQSNFLSEEPVTKNHEGGHISRHDSDWTATLGTHDA
jgi:hypothetical protein